MFLSKYGVARHIYLPIVKRGVVDLAVSADWTPAAGDVKISKDGGAAANVTNLPVAIAMGNTAVWDYSITATEMQAAQVVITIADAATKAVEDQTLIIETYGNASAQHAFDLATATQKVDVDTIKTNPVVNGGTITFPTTATLASTTNITAGTVTTATNLTNAPTAGDFTAAMKTSLNAATPASVVGAVGSVTGAVGSVTGNVGGNVVGSVASVAAAVTVGTNNDKTGYALTSAYDFAKGTVAMTESYAAKGVVPTPEQILFEARSLLAEVSASGTLLTAKKIDGATTAGTYTLNDATNPTSVTRAS